MTQGGDLLVLNGMVVVSLDSLTRILKRVDYTEMLPSTRNVPRADHYVPRGHDMFYYEVLRQSHP